MWTMDAVEREWLRWGRIAYQPRDVVDAFNVVERTLGRAWMEASRTFDGMVALGPHSTAAIVDMGQRLASLEGVVGAEELITRLKRNDESANAELTAVHLLRRDRPSAEVELSPEVKVGAGSRKPDFECGQRRVIHVECSPLFCSGRELRLAARTGRLNPDVRRVPR